jgi:hypothetical protein
MLPQMFQENSCWCRDWEVAYGFSSAHWWLAKVHNCFSWQFCFAHEEYTLLKIRSNALLQIPYMKHDLLRVISWKEGLHLPHVIWTEMMIPKNVPYTLMRNTYYCGHLSCRSSWIPKVMSSTCSSTSGVWTNLPHPSIISGNRQKDSSLYKMPMNGCKCVLGWTLSL